MSAQSPRYWGAACQQRGQSQPRGQSQHRGEGNCIFKLGASSKHQSRTLGVGRQSFRRTPADTQNTDAAQRKKGEPGGGRGIATTTGRLGWLVGADASASRSPYCYRGSPGKSRGAARLCSRTRWARRWAGLTAWRRGSVMIASHYKDQSAPISTNQRQSAPYTSTGTKTREPPGVVPINRRGSVIASDCKAAA